MGAFLFLSIFICLIELVGSNIALLGYKSNYHTSNLYVFVSSFSYLYIYYKILNLRDEAARAYKITGAVVMLVLLYNYLFFEGPFRLNSIGVVIEQLITIMLSCTLLFRIAISEKYFIVWKEPYFWIAAGLLIFSLGTLVVFGFLQYIRINHLTIKNKSLYAVIMPVLNVILYSAYTYAFYLCKPKKKLYSPLSSL
jgi:magnesium-transporting ATPase (P-type)